MGAALTALLVLLFFAPLSFVYGRSKACAIAAAEPRPLRARLTGLLPLPLLVLAATLFALAEVSRGNAWRQENLTAMLTGDPLSGTPGLETGNGAVDFALWLAHSIGGLSMILFFVSIPYVMGSLVAAILLVGEAAGRIDLSRPLRSDAAHEMADDAADRMDDAKPEERRTS